MPEFYDDSSKALDLGHSYRTAKPVCRRCSLDIIGPIPESGFCQACDEHEQKERAIYFAEIDVKGQCVWLIEYYITLGHRKSDAEETAIARYLSLRPGVYERMQKYMTDRKAPDGTILAGLPMDEAVIEAERDLFAEDDFANKPIGKSGEVEDATPDSQGPWPEHKVLSIMAAKKRIKGSHSSSNGRKRGRPPKFHDKDANYQEAIAEIDMRTEMVAGRVSEPVKCYLRAGSANASAGEVVEVVVQAMIDAGCGLGMIKTWLDERIEAIDKDPAA